MHWLTGARNSPQRNCHHQRAIQTHLKAKDVARKWESTVLYGDSTADPNAFDRTEMLSLCVGVLAPLFTHPRAGEPATDTLFLI